MKNLTRRKLRKMILQEMDFAGGTGLDPETAENIIQAIKQAKDQDIILVAGKGHESTQEINGNFINFSDREVVTRILSGLKRQ